MKTSANTRKKIKKIRELLAGKTTMLIVMQDNPDPDAIASATALRLLANNLAGVSCFISHGGVVGRAENVAMVKYLDLKLHTLDNTDLARFDVLAMVDTQPFCGSNSLPETRIPDLVIDHHPIRNSTRKVTVTDIRSRYGATSTIAYEYLIAAGIEPDVPLATALLYGIRSDTQDLGQEAGRRDIEAFLELYPRANKRALSRIAHGRVTRDYYQMLATGLLAAQAFGKTVITSLGEIDNPDMIAEVADLLLRDDLTCWAMCYGTHNNTIRFSLRTSEPGANAGVVARKVAGPQGSGGGHRALAAGQVPLKQENSSDTKKTFDLLLKRFLRAVGEGKYIGKGERLLTTDPCRNPS